MKRTVSILIFTLIFGCLAFGARPQSKLFCEAPTQGKSASREPSSLKSKLNGVTVVQADPTIDLDPLSAQGYDVVKFDEMNNPSAWDEPSPRLRDYLIHEADLDREVSSWDHLQKDMFFLRAQEYPLKRLVAKYPKLPPVKLDILQRKISVAKQATQGRER